MGQTISVVDAQYSAVLVDDLLPELDSVRFFDGCGTLAAKTQG